MAKTKPFSFRIDNNLYSNTKRLADSLNVSFAELIEKALSYFRHNPEQVLKFPSDSRMLEYYELSKDPERTLSSLKEQGITTLSQLYWIISFIGRAWQGTNNVTVSWLARLTSLLKLLLQKQVKNEQMEDLTQYVLSSFPQTGESIEERIDKSQSFLEGKNKISSVYAGQVMECLSIVLRKGDFSISEEQFREINALLTPWCFWVVTRALSSKQEPLNLDVTPLLTDIVPQKKKFIEESSDVTVQVFLSSDGIGPMKAGKREFSCGFALKCDGQLLAEIVCTAKDVYDLLEVILMIEDNIEIARKGPWEIMKNDKENAFTVRKSGVLIPVPKKTLENFMDLALKLYSNQDVQRDILKEYIEQYGAV